MFTKKRKYILDKSRLHSKWENFRNKSKVPHYMPAYYADYATTYEAHAHHTTRRCSTTARTIYAEPVWRTEPMENATMEEGR